MASPMMPNTQPVSPNTPLAVTLEAQQWNGVISALVKAPYELAAPLIQSITQQLQDAANANAVPSNGIDRAALGREIAGPTE
jgi:hypothetical protein